MPQEIQTVKLVRYAVFVPGLVGGAFYVELPEGSPPPVVTASPGAMANAPGIVPATITLPAFVSRKRPITATVLGKPRTLSACVACLLEAHKRGERLKARPETMRRWAEELPEFTLRRDDSRKCLGGFVAVLVEGVVVS